MFGVLRSMGIISAIYITEILSRRKVQKKSYNKLDITMLYVHLDHSCI